MVDVVEVVEEQRFEARDADGSLLGISAYDAQGSTVVFTHTEVLPAAEGRGSAAGWCAARWTRCARRGVTWSRCARS